MLQWSPQGGGTASGVWNGSAARQNEKALKIGAKGGVPYGNYYPRMDRKGVWTRVGRETCTPAQPFAALAFFPLEGPLQEWVSGFPPERNCLAHSLTTTGRVVLSLGSFWQGSVADVGCPPEEEEEEGVEDLVGTEGSCPCRSASWRAALQA